jgi:hypothetical protein
MKRVSRDKSVTRSAQDDVFVVNWRCKKQRLLGFPLSARFCGNFDENIQNKLALMGARVAKVDYRPMTSGG